MPNDNLEDNADHRYTTIPVTFGQLTAETWLIKLEYGAAAFENVEIVNVAPDLGQAGKELEMGVFAHREECVKE